MGDVLSLCQAVAVDSSQRLKLYDGFNQFLLLALAREVGDFNITVNAILPGATVTEVARETVSPEQMKAMIQSRCIKRPQEVSDLTGLVGFLCSREADFITGQSFVVDGGLTVT